LLFSWGTLAFTLPDPDERMASVDTALRILLEASTGAQKERSSLPAPSSAARHPSSGCPRLNAGARPHAMGAADDGAHGSALP
jgi:hypothetical protein